MAARARARRADGHAGAADHAGRQGDRAPHARAQFGGVEDKDLIALCYGSADFREGLDAFLAKRKPKFNGR